MNQIKQLFNMILYVQHNKGTLCLQLVHFYEETVARWHRKWRPMQSVRHSLHTLVVLTECSLSSYRVLPPYRCSSTGTLIADGGSARTRV